MRKQNGGAQSGCLSPSECFQPAHPVYWPHSSGPPLMLKTKMVEHFVIIINVHPGLFKLHQDIFFS